MSKNDYIYNVLSNKTHIIIAKINNKKNQSAYKAKRIRHLKQDLFKLLISVSGVGPKTAIQFLSSTSAEALKNKIKSGEVEALTSIPGIGAKTAKRIIIEIKEKITSESDNDIPTEGESSIEVEYKDALDALLVLGYLKKDITNCINKIIKKDKMIDTPDLIKKVLNKIGK